MFAAILMLALMLPSVANASILNEYIEDFNLDANPPFADVEANHINHRAINFSSVENIIQGYEDGTFGPDKAVNRAELIKIVVEYTFETPDVNAYHNCFNDINQEWYAPYVCYAKENAGYVQGYEDDTYRPANEINRVEAIKIISQALMPNDFRPTLTADELAIPMPVDLDMAQWYADDIRFVILKELVDGYHVTQNADGSLNFHPGDSMTRKEVVEMIYRIDFYFVERELYATAMADGACFMAVNNDALSEADLDTGFYQVFAQYGWNVEEADAVSVKYYYDDYLDAQIKIHMESACAEGAEYDNSMVDADGNLIVVEGISEM